MSFISITLILVVLFHFFVFHLFLFQKRSIDGGKQGGTIRKMKRDKAGSATGKSAKPEANTISVAPRAKPELPLPVYSLMSKFSFNRLCIFYIGCRLKLKALCYLFFIFSRNCKVKVSSSIL